MFFQCVNKLFKGNFSIIVGIKPPKGILNILKCEFIFSDQDDDHFAKGILPEIKEILLYLFVSFFFESIEKGIEIEVGIMDLISNGAYDVVQVLLQIVYAFHFVLEKGVVK